MRNAAGVRRETTMADERNEGQRVFELKRSKSRKPVFCASATVPSQLFRQLRVKRFEWREVAVSDPGIFNLQVIKILLA
jgi:hypothetical protein